MSTGIPGNDERGDNNDNIIFGTIFDDTLRGLGGNDRLFGDAGCDLLIGQGDNDSLFGDGDNDTLIGGEGDDELTGGAGIDQFRFGANEGSDTITDFERGPGGDLLNFRTINAPDPTLLGDISQVVDGDDLIVSFGGTTVRLTHTGVDGPLGIENFFGIYTHIAPDTGGKTIGTSGRDSILGGIGNDELVGKGGADALLGGQGSDRLDGGNANDTLDGGMHADFLIGGAGDDVLRGGQGMDKFVMLKNSGSDTILDFVSGEDFIKVAFLHLPNGFADINIIDNGTNSLVTFDTDSTSIIVENFVGLQESDFII